MSDVQLENIEVDLFIMLIVCFLFREKGKHIAFFFFGNEYLTNSNRVQTAKYIISLQTVSSVQQQQMWAENFF